MQTDIVVQPTSMQPAAAPAGELRVTEHLTSKELAEAEALALALDPNDALAVAGFGVNPQRELSALVDPILQKVSAQQSGPAGEALVELMAQVRSLDAGSLGAHAETSLAGLPLVGGWFSSLRQFQARSEKIGAKIERIAVRLEDTKRGLAADVAMLDQLYAQNAAYFRSLLIYIAAGEMKLGAMTAQQAAQAEAARSANDVIQAQAAADMGQAVARLERRVYDLKLAAMVALQTAPQIRLVQHGDQTLMEKIQSSILTTIPLWKYQVSLALSLAQQARALKVQRAVTDATNEMIRQNAEGVRLGTAATAREGERAIVAIETLREVNETLIQTIDETLQIQEEGRRQRQAAEAELATLQEQLRGKLAAVRAGQAQSPAR